MNKRERDKWAKAIKECIEQDSYGNYSTCSLCQTEKSIDCANCICIKYAGKRCVTMLSFKYLNNKRFIRSYLRKMLKWVETGAKPRRKT